MINVLWLAPNFNHYKARFLNHLAKSSSIYLTILSGTGRQEIRGQELEGQWDFKQIKVTVGKNNFSNYYLSNCLSDFLHYKITTHSALRAINLFYF